MNDETIRCIEADKSHCWHPFTRQSDWCAPSHEPIVIAKGQGAWLEDTEGRRYLDGNASIWTNIHGHAHPTLIDAISQQLHLAAHVSFLGYTHPLAPKLAKKLCSFFPQNSLERVFFSDNGSTAIECALKMEIQYRIQTQSQRNTFVAFHNGYHGDTLGAASLGGVSRFFDRFKQHGYAVHHVHSLADLDSIDPETIAAVIIEPLIQGVNEMRPWQPGMLKELRHWCNQTGAHLILDEVMTGFGRTGKMFACQHEEVIPDFLCLAKGLTGGYLPMAATLTTQPIYNAFLGAPENTFYYGHSFTANPLGCAAALANLEIFEQEQTLENLQPKIEHLRRGLSSLKSSNPWIYEIRQCGWIAGIEIRQPDGSRFPPKNRTGEKICFAARSFGLLTRPILDTIVLLLPLCTQPDEIDLALHAINSAISSHHWIDS